MKLLRRNLRKFEYLPYKSTERDWNDSNEHTGEFYPEYGEPVEYWGNISTPSGKVNQTFYGQEIRYTHVLLMDNPDVPICEKGIVRWKGEDYEVQAVKPSLNSVSIALRKQTENKETSGCEAWQH